MAAKTISRATILQTGALAWKAGFRGDGLSKAIAVALAESGGKDIRGYERNSNGTYDWGRWQINEVHKQTVATLQPDIKGQRFNPDGYRDGLYIARWAFELSKGGTDWSPWSTWPGEAARYLPMAVSVTASMTADEWSKTPLGQAVVWTGEAVEGAVEAVGDAAAAVADAVTPDGIGAFFGALTDSDTWVRVGLVLGGAAVVLLAVGYANKGTIAGAVTTAVAPASAVVKAVK